MKKALKVASGVLANGRRRAFISRVAWLDLDQLVSSAFDEIAKDSPETDELGCLYLSKNRDHPPFNQPRFNTTNVTNQIQVHAGWRHLNVNHAILHDDAEPRAEWLAESAATLWFSQDATGSVAVFLAPYKSKAMKMNEENIILARHKCATDVTERHVRLYFKKFFRYCAVTSVHGELGVGGYVYRLWLQYNDFRFASQMRATAFRCINPLLAGVGIVATLYAGNKLFS